MEEGQRLGKIIKYSTTDNYVLILVVMEEGQRLHGRGIISSSSAVLILVVMEEGQRHLCRTHGQGEGDRLNPCCNGRASKTGGEDRGHR